jgi:hypothetical protein
MNPPPFVPEEAYAKLLPAAEELRAARRRHLTDPRRFPAAWIAAVASTRVRARQLAVPPETPA